MAFFEKDSNLWQNLLSDSEQGGDVPEENTDQVESERLTEAATTSRVLSADEVTRPTLRGVLSVRIRMASLIKFEKYLMPSMGSFCVITTRNIVKRTQTARDCDGIIKWDQTKHFPVQVIRNKRHPYNLVNIELFGFSASNPNETEPLGSVRFHLHDIISANPIAGTYDLWNEYNQIGDIDLEFTFSYGAFGYGHSPQLKEEDSNPEEIVSYSLFPRLLPRRSQREPDGPCVMNVCATPHPTFIRFEEKVYLSYAREIREQLEEAVEGMYKPELLIKEMSDFHKVHQEYYSTSNRFSRLLFLRNYLASSTKQNQVRMDDNDHGTSGDRSFISKDYTRFVSNASSDRTVLASPQQRRKSSFFAPNANVVIEQDETGFEQMSLTPQPNLLVASARGKKGRNNRIQSFTGDMDGDNQIQSGL